MEFGWLTTTFGVILFAYLHISPFLKNVENTCRNVSKNHPILDQILTINPHGFLDSSQNDFLASPGRHRKPKSDRIHFLVPVFGIYGAKRVVICSRLSYGVPPFCRPCSRSLGWGTLWVNLMPFLMIRGVFLMLFWWYPVAVATYFLSKNQWFYV